MPTFSSATVSSATSPQASRYVARTESTQDSRPRLLRTGHGHQQHMRCMSSQSGSKVHASDLKGAPCLSPRSSRKCLKCQQTSHEAAAGLFPIRSGRDASSSRHRVRSREDDSGSPPPCSPRNETPQFDLNCSLQPARSQVHQRPHQPLEAKHTNRRLALGRQAQVAPSTSPVSPVFPLPPSSFSAPSTPPQHRRAVRNRTHSTPEVSISTFASPPASPLSRCIHPPPSDYPTPSPSTRSRKSRSVSFASPLFWLRPPTLSFLAPDGCPPRASATLAMSIQIHSPSPIMSVRPTSPPTNTRSHSRSRSRPPSPLSPSSPLSRPPMPRPPSRSERLLRDTLRRAEEHDRLMSLSALPSPSTFGATQPAHGFFSPAPAGGRRLRRNTTSSTGTDGSLDAFAYRDTGAYDSDEEQDDEIDHKQWLWRSPSSSSSSSAHGNAQANLRQTHQQQPPLPRYHNDDLEKRNATWRSRAHSDVVHVDLADPSPSAYGSATSQSARAQLQRSMSNTSRPSLPRAHSHASHSHTRNPPDGDRFSCGCCPPGSVITPHEAVLRSRLEGVLRGARAHERTRSVEVGGWSGSSNSFASSRNISGEGENFFAAGTGEPGMTSAPPVSNPPELPVSPRARTNTSATAPANMYTHRRSSSASPQVMRSRRSSAHPSAVQEIEPLTPPPSPPFNPTVAAAQCRAMDGYVSFANVGLDVPGGEDDVDEAESSSAHSWLKWLTLGSRRGESAVASR